MALHELLCYVMHIKNVPVEGGKLFVERQNRSSSSRAKQAKFVENKTQ